jgi:hypothetical protein
MLLIFSALALCNNLAWCVRFFRVHPIFCQDFLSRIFVVWLSDIVLIFSSFSVR